MVFESRTPCAADRSGFLAKPAGPPPVAPKHNNPQVKPVGFESRTPCAVDRSGFLAKPASRKVSEVEDRQLDRFCYELCFRYRQKESKSGDSL